MKIQQAQFRMNNLRRNWYLIPGDISVVAPGTAGSLLLVFPVISSDFGVYDRWWIKFDMKTPSTDEISYYGLNI